MKFESLSHTISTGDPLGQWRDAPEEWVQKTLWDLAEYVNGRAFKPNDFSPDGLLVIKIAELKEGLSRSTKRYNGVFENKHLLRTGDILFAWSGNPETSLDVFRWRGGGALLNQHIFRVLPRSDVDPNYLFFLIRFLRPTFIRTARDKATSMGHVKVADLKRLIARVPSLEEQKQISKILSSLEFKIELNQQMNKTLESTARALFKHWFVDFDFPNGDGKPYKSSGGKIVDSEAGQVPEGWEVASLDNVAEFTRGFSYSGSEKSDVNGEYVFVTLNSVKEGGGFKREFSFITSDRIRDRHFVRGGEIVIANTEQTKTGTLLGCPALVEFPSEYTKDRAVFSHHITKVVTKSRNLKHYLYYHLFTNQQNAVMYNTGSVIWALDVSNWAKNEKLTVPPERILQQFESLMDTIFRKSKDNNLQTETLSQLRDSLLPRLMSGKIRVPVEVK